MIELSLEKINTQSPYEVSYAPNGDFVFATNLGIHYLISFENETPLGDKCPLSAIITEILQRRYVRQVQEKASERGVLHDFLGL